MSASASLSIAAVVDQVGGVALPDPVVLAPGLRDVLGEVVDPGKRRGVRTAWWWCSLPCLAIVWWWWSAIRGRLPWALMAFLADAHQRGVLRQVQWGYMIRHGELHHVWWCYEFRHAELQRRLATRS